MDVSFLDPYENLALNKGVYARPDIFETRAVSGFSYVEKISECFLARNVDQVYWTVDLNHLYEVQVVYTYIPPDLCCSK